MRIGHIGLHFLPDYGGSSTRLYNLLSRLPWETWLFVPDTMGMGEIIAKKEEQFDKIWVRRIPLCSHSLFRRFAPFQYLYRVFQVPNILSKSLSEENFDLIHTHGYSISKRVIRTLTMDGRIPLIFELLGLGKDDIGDWEKFPHRFYLNRNERESFTFSDHVITITHSQKEWVHQTYAIPVERITVVPNGVDIEMFAPQEELETSRLKETLHLQGKVVMYAGYMDRVNGMIDLVKAVPEIIQARANILFVFIGYGPEEKRVMALSKAYPNNVKYLPMVPYQKMPVYYQMCDVYIIPRPSTVSAEMITPLKLLEAMAMEKPVLGSNVGGIAEVIKHGENGYLFEKGNVESFKKTLLQVLDADNAQIGKNARKIVVNNYSWDKSAKILQKVYESLV